MAILIDGYNLLHATGIVGTGPARSSLERSRRALLNFLAKAIPENQLTDTTIVFDAQGAPPGLPKQLSHRGIAVHFAADHPEADDLIEVLIRDNHVPRKLVVVSSDHRIQRSARRRKAIPIDSDVWFDQLETSLRWRPAKPAGEATPDKKRQTMRLDADEVAEWLEEFGDVNIEETLEPPSQSKPPKPHEKEAVDEIDNPFPEDYMRKLLDEFE